MDGTAVGPLVCPFCGRQIKSSYRYGNLIKRKREMIEKLHATTSNDFASKEQQDAVVEKVLSSFLLSQFASKEQQDSVFEKFLLNFFPSLAGRHQRLMEGSKQLPAMFKKLPTLLSKPCTTKTLSIVENEIDQYILIKEYESLYQGHPESLTSLQQLLEFFKATPPSAQKTLDVYCERQRIFLLWVISSLEVAVSSSNQDYNVLKQLKEKLVFNRPKLTLPNVSTYFDELQNMAHRVKKSFAGVDSHSLKPSRANFINGVWTVCTNGHVYCKPRGLSGMDIEIWGCPDCPC